MQKITDHGSRAVAMLISQDKKETIPALVRAAATEVQAAENALYDLVSERMLTTAVGVQLDQYGLIVGVLRSGLSDADFAKIISARIAANLCCGNPEQITTILSALTGNPVRYSQNGIAAYRLEIVDGRLVPKLIISSMNSISAYWNDGQSHFHGSSIPLGAYTYDEFADAWNVATRLPFAGVEFVWSQGKAAFQTVAGRNIGMSSGLQAMLGFGSSTYVNGLVSGSHLPVVSTTAEDAAWLTALGVILADVRPAGVDSTEVVSGSDGFLFDDDDLGFDSGSLGRVL